MTKRPHDGPAVPMMPNEFEEKLEEYFQDKPYCCERVVGVREGARWGYEQGVAQGEKGFQALYGAHWAAERVLHTEAQARLDSEWALIAQRDHYKFEVESLRIELCRKNAKLIETQDLLLLAQLGLPEGANE